MWLSVQEKKRIDIAHSFIIVIDGLKNLNYTKYIQLYQDACNMLAQ